MAKSTKSKQMSVLLSAEERALLERERDRLGVRSIATVIRMRIRFHELRTEPQTTRDSALLAGLKDVYEGSKRGESIKIISSHD